MSWVGFKKAINRAGAQVMLKTGHMEQTVDREYEYEEKRFRSMERTSLKLQRELRSYLETLRILTNAQVNVGEVLSEFYGDDSNKSNVSREYNEVVKYINDNGLKELEGPYNHTVLNPVGRFNSYYVDVNEAIKKRAHKKVDYDAMKQKVKKLVEKPTPDEHYETKLSTSQDQLQESEKLYEELNDQLKNDLPQLINLRIPFFDPSFESFVKLQLRFFNENYSQLNKLQLRMDAKTREDYVNGTLDKRIDNVLSKMKELNITSV